MSFDSWPGGSWEATLKLGVTILALYFAVVWVALVFWTYRDIRQRSRDPVIQFAAVLLVLVFFLPGHWIYLILRPRVTLVEAYERSLEEEALLQELEDQKACPTCKRRIQDDYLVCPSCAVQLKEPCRSCSKPLSYSWAACPYCGLAKTPRERKQRSQQVPPPPQPSPVIAPRPSPAPREGTTISRSGSNPRPMIGEQQRAPALEGLDDGPLIDATRE